jgi:hypothetical protein
MQTILKSYGRALLMQFNLKMLLLSLLPSLLALTLWAVVLYLSLQPFIDYLQQYFVDNNGFEFAGKMLSFFGLLALKAVLVPLVAMWLLLPLMLLTALLFVTCIAMPLINRAVSQQYFPQLEKRYGGSWWGSLGSALFYVALFLMAWLVSLPLTLFPPLGMMIQPVLLGWLTYRVMTYDALAIHASQEERRTILQQQRWPLWTVGILVGLLGAVPGMVWLGGVLSIIFLPLLAAVAIWLYVLIFMFSGFWFQLFCLDALQQLRNNKPL